MANKYVQRWMRSLGFFFSSHQPAQRILQNAQGLSHTTWMQSSAKSASSSLPAADDEGERSNGEQGSEEMIEHEKLLPSVIKSVLHCTNSRRHSPEEASCGGRSLYKFTRSWSSPSSLNDHTSVASADRQGRATSLPSSRAECQQQQVNMTRGKRAPKGHVAVYVEAGRERRVVPIAYLSHPRFQALLQRAQSEFGFRQKGGLLIPCSLSELHHTLLHIHTASNSCISAS